MTSFFSRLGTLAAKRTVVGKKVDLATTSTDAPSNPSWELNLDICDLIQDKGAAENAVKVLVSKLNPKASSSGDVDLALCLLECVVKNCGFVLHEAVATERVMSLLKELAISNEYRGSRLQSKSRSIVKQLGVAFSSQAHTLPLFLSTYEELQRAGVMFDDSNSAPVFTPPPSIVLSTAKKHAASSNKTENTGSISYLEQVEHACSNILAESSNRDTQGGMSASFHESGQYLLRSRAQIGAQVQKSVVDGNLDTEMLDRLFRANDLVATCITLYKSLCGGNAKSHSGILDATIVGVDGGDSPSHEVIVAQVVHIDREVADCSLAESIDAASKGAGNVLHEREKDDGNNDRDDEDEGEDEDEDDESDSDMLNVLQRQSSKS